jgi:hypothetical protein
MSEFLDVINRWASGVDTAAIFSGDGRNLSHTSEARRDSQKYVKVLTNFEEAYGNMLAGHRPSRRLFRAMVEGDLSAYRALGEAVSTSDFPLLFGDTIDRVLLAKYKAVIPNWQDYIKVSRVADFRDVKRFKCSPGRGLLPVVKQGEAYTNDKPSESYYSFGVQKRGSVRNILWEALINDDLSALADVPNDFSYQAQQTEAYVATSLFAANTTLYATNHSVNGATYSNKGTAKFSADALATAISAMGEYPGDDSDGLPVMNDPVYIVVGTRAMQLKVEQVLNSLIVAYAGSTDKTNLPTANIISQELRSRLQVRLNPYLRLLDPTNYANSWYLFSDPADGYSVEFAYLSGYDTPQMFMRASAQLALGGGTVSPMEGGYDNDSVDYKVRVVMGGSHTNAVGGWRFSYWSDGSAS